MPKTIPRRRRWNGPKTWVPSPWRLRVCAGRLPLVFLWVGMGIRNQPYSRGLYTNYKDSLYYEYIDWTLFSWTKILTSQLYVIIIPARCPVITTLLGTKISPLKGTNFSRCFDQTSLSLGRRWIRFNHWDLWLEAMKLGSWTSYPKKPISGASGSDHWSYNSSHHHPLGATHSRDRLNKDTPRMIRNYIKKTGESIMWPPDHTWCPWCHCFQEILPQKWRQKIGSLDRGLCVSSDVRIFSVNDVDYRAPNRMGPSTVSKENKLWTKGDHGYLKGLLGIVEYSLNPFVELIHVTHGSPWFFRAMLQTLIQQISTSLPGLRYVHKG